MRKLGIKFDMSDPQVARESLIVTLDAVVQSPRNMRRDAHALKSCASMPPSKPSTNATEVVTRQKTDAKAERDAFAGRYGIIHP
jgi:hypothetical protein